MNLEIIIPSDEPVRLLSAVTEELDYRRLTATYSRLGRILDFVLPIGALIVLAMCQGELFLAVVASILTCMILHIPRKKLSPARFFDLAMHVFCNMIPTIAIIFFAFVMQEAMADIGIAG